MVIIQYDVYIIKATGNHHQRVINGYGVLDDVVELAKVTRCDSEEEAEREIEDLLKADSTLTLTVLKVYI